MTSISVKTPYYSPWFLAKNSISSERASQEEQNGHGLHCVCLFVPERFHKRLSPEFVQFDELFEHLDVEVIAAEAHQHSTRDTNNSQ